MYDSSKNVSKARYCTLAGGCGVHAMSSSILSSGSGDKPRLLLEADSLIVTDDSLSVAVGVKIGVPDSMSWTPEDTTHVT